MTREEAKQWIKDLISTMKLETSGSFPDAPYKDEVYEALDEAVKALSQDSCEDAISRQEVIEYIKASDAELGHSSEKEIVVEDILNMSPVTPTKCIATVKFSKEDMQELVNEKMKDIVVERKKGKWINKSQKSGCGITFAISKCTCCGKNTFFDCDELLYRYCPNCGAEMESEE